MCNSNYQLHNATEINGAAPAKSHTWAVRAVGFILLLQVVGLAGGTVYYSAGIDLPRLLQMLENTSVDRLPLAALISITYNFYFIPLALLTTLAAITFLFLRRMGWTLAMIAEGLMLLICVSLYFDDQEYTFIYPVMASCIIMVLLLNSAIVQATFHATIVDPLGESHR